jgi:hypothetical protein
MLDRVHIAQHLLPQTFEGALNLPVGLALELLCLALRLAGELICLSLCLAGDLVRLSLCLAGDLVRLALGLTGGLGHGLLDGASDFL